MYVSSESRREADRSKSCQVSVAVRDMKQHESTVNSPSPRLLPGSSRQGGGGIMQIFSFTTVTYSASTQKQVEGKLHLQCSKTYNLNITVEHSISIELLHASK